MAGRQRVRVADIKVRLKEPLRARVEAAARDRGVSMNAEFISRLERSFVQDDELQVGPSGKDVILFMRAIMAAMKKAGEISAASRRPAAIVTDPPWLTEPHAFDQAVRAANGVMEAFRPPSEQFLPPATADARESGEHRQSTKTYNSLDAELALALTDAVIAKKHSSLAELREHVLLELERLFSRGFGFIPRAQIENIEEQEHEGQHHSTGKVQLAAKVRSGSARSSDRKKTHSLPDSAGHKKASNVGAHPATRKDRERHGR